MYVAKPANKNGGSAAAARSWGQRRGVAALGWVRNTRVVERTAPGAPERMPGGECGRSGMFLLTTRIQRRGPYQALIEKVRER